jgi:predicted nuclease of restriction endonuclease-like (RecB) superfamily
MMNLKTDTLYFEIKTVIENARTRAYKAINSAMVQAYWHIGRLIVEADQKGETKAEYGKALIKELSKRLTHDFGKGFTTTNLKYMRQFYLTFPISHALRDKSDVNTLHPELSWTHYRLMLKVENPKARRFYIQECIESKWSTRQLERQINSFYYERLLSSQNKQAVREEAETKAITLRPENIIKDPYVLEFLDLKENSVFLEKDLEEALIGKLQAFLLELGKGFAFVARQQRITADGEHFYVDLVFYNYLLKCFVLIDLKLGKLTHQDIGQMDFYVRYYENEIKTETDHPTIGIILCSEKNETIVKYSVLKESQQLFASQYKLYLPTEEVISDGIEKDFPFLRISQNDVFQNLFILLEHSGNCIGIHENIC